MKLTDEDEAEIQARAAALGVSVPLLLVQSALGQGTSDRVQRVAHLHELSGIRRLVLGLFKEVDRVQRTFGGAASNLNQEVRFLNGGRGMDAALVAAHERDVESNQQVLQELAELRIAMAEVAAKLGE